MTTLKPLTSRQESRLIAFLDDSLLTISRDFETRRSPLANLSSIDLYFEALHNLHSIILTIPPIAPSASLRVAYYLQITSLLPDALSGYELDPNSPTLWTLLRTFDDGWVAILDGRMWDSSTGLPKPGEVEGTSGVRGTDRVRLGSIILDVRQTLNRKLHLPNFVPLKINPFAEIVEPSLGIQDLKVGDENVDEGLEVGMSCAGVPFVVDDSEVEEEAAATPLENATSTTTASTPSLVSDGMDIDLDEEDDDDEDAKSDSDDSNFDEVEIVSPSSRAAPDDDHEEGGFSISYTPDLLPSLPPRSPEPPNATSQAKGFDPDEEYGSAEEELEENYEEEVEKVFRRTEERLESMKA